jgi:hypothetical protein
LGTKCDLAGDLERVPSLFAAIAKDRKLSRRVLASNRPLQKAARQFPVPGKPSFSRVLKKGCYRVVDAVDFTE